MAFLDEVGLAELWSLITAKDNALAASDVKIASGSYIGTGTYGSSNPSSLTFDFEPKVVMLFDNLGKLMNEYGVSSNSQSCVGVCSALTTEFTAFNGNRVFWGGVATSGSYSASTQYKISADRKTIYWMNRGKEVTYNNFSEYNATAAQYNVSGTTYYYFAIG